jgi:hypothetical protein
MTPFLIRMRSASPLPVVLTLRVLLSQDDRNLSGIDAPDHIRLLLYHLSVIDAALENVRELQGRIAVTIQPEGSFIDLLRDTLRKLQEEPEPAMSSLEDLKCILRERIEDLETR